MDQMNEILKIKAPGREEDEILAATYEAGKPCGADMGRWSQKLNSRDAILKYLQTGQRYFYSQDWFGSEKRKTPA
jgi:hypothetical protein